MTLNKFICKFNHIQWIVVIILAPWIIGAVIVTPHYKPKGYTLIEYGVGVNHNDDTIKVQTFRERYNLYKQLPYEYR